MLKGLPGGWEPEKDNLTDKTYEISLNRRELKILGRLKNDFVFFFENAIKIEGKVPGSVYGYNYGHKDYPNEKKLTLNTAQRIFIAKIFDMLERKGYVRLIVVKGRQQGISTIIEMLFLWLAIFVPNTKICIIAHEAKASSALFEKVEFAHANLPEPIKPKLLTAQTGKTLKFDNNSKYMVLTAGTEETGRSQTAHHKHESERAFFGNPDKVDAGVGQIVPDIAGTFDFKESTGNGMNHFYQEVLDAIAGKGKFEYVFIPWFVQEEYRSVPDEGFKPDEEEQKQIDMYGLDYHQLQWRRDKVVFFKGNLRKFKQEYPCFLMEAFQMGADSFYDPDLVNAAMESDYEENFGARILGVDGARDGDDTIIAYRRGRQVVKLWDYQNMTEPRLAGIIMNLMDELNIDRTFVDTAYGWAAIDLCHGKRYKNVEGISFAQAPTDSQFANKRAEMIFAFDVWLKEGMCSIPKDDKLAADIAMMPPYELTSSGKILFPSKKDIRKKLHRSPDRLDATILTFAFPVKATKEDEEVKTTTRGVKNGSPLKTLSKLKRNRQDDKRAPFRWRYTPRELPQAA